MGSPFMKSDVVTDKIEKMTFSQLEKFHPAGGLRTRGDAATALCARNKSLGQRQAATSCQK